MDSKLRFKAVREHYGLSMSAFGEKIGLSASGVSAIEYGTRAFTEKHIKLIHAEFPEISEEWLRSGSGNMIVEESATDIAIESALRNTSGSPALRAFLVAYSKLNDQNRAILEQFVSDYVEEYRSAVVAESIKKDAAVFDNIIPNPHFVSVPMNGVAVQDGTVEAKHAAAKEQNELDDESGESLPLPSDFSYKPFMRNPNDDIKVIR